MRILGKGITAQAIKQKHPNATWYDNDDINSFDKKSDELTVVSPGIPPYNELVKQSKNLISEYDFLIPDDMFTIWISGTNGKTTTTAMIHHLLQKYGAQCGGNIGTPLAHLDTSAPIWILETSSFTLHYTNKKKPNLYILLPISDDHTSWHGSFSEYETAKLKPLRSMYSDDIAILPAKYKSLDTDAFCIYYDNTDELIAYFDMDLKSIDYDEPFLLDSVLALACEKIVFDSLSYTKINNFQRGEHTLEELYDKKNRLWVNDSKGTNINASIQALKMYKEKNIELIIGGDDKGADLEEFFVEMIKYKINIYLIGSNIQKTESLAQQYAITYNICETMENAINLIDKKLIKNESVGLLSPAAASLDQFSSYKQRGEIFKNIVRNL